MRNVLILTGLLSFVLLAGCKPQNAAAPAAPATSAQPDAEAGKAGQQPAKRKGEHRKARVASPSRIAEIEASGKTGLWADPAEACPGTRTAMLAWNVASSGAKKVSVYVVGKDGKEHRFGRGGPVGERRTGPWVRPGTVFKLRNDDGGAELGGITMKPGASC